MKFKNHIICKKLYSINLMGFSIIDNKFALSIYFYFLILSNVEVNNSQVVKNNLKAVVEIYKIIGNMHSSHTDYSDARGLADEITRMATAHGAEGVILYGNARIDRMALPRLKQQLERQSGKGLRILDAMRIDNGLSEGYESAQENGALEPYTEYGEADIDKAYLEAVESGDMDTASAMVRKAAQEAGYFDESPYQGTSAFNGVAPSNAYGWSKQERKEKWESGEFEGDYTLGDHIDFMGETGDQLDFLINDPNGFASSSNMGRESILAIREAIRRGDRKITVYRSIPSQVKEGSLRDGDWVTPSRSYAKDNAALHGWGRKYRIIEQSVDFDNLWWDGNDINEWGFDRGSNTGYKNTRNNRKLLDAVTYDDNGEVIPLSKRFNERKEDERYREGDGAYSDEELSNINDPWYKASWGEASRSKKQQKTYAERMRRAMRDKIAALTGHLKARVDVEIIDDSSQLEGKKQTAKGWFDPRTGKICIVLGNHSSTLDIQATLLHEMVAHKGLRDLFGAKFDAFLDAVYANAEDRIKEQIDVLAIKNGWNRRVATEEYLAGLAEDASFADIKGSWWQKLKALFMDFLRGCGFSPNVKISDNELRYVLWMSWKNLQEPGAFRTFLGIAEKVVKEDQLKVGEYAETSGDKHSDAAEPLFRDGDFTPRDRKLARDYYEGMLAQGSWQFREATQDSMLGLRSLYESILTQGDKAKRKDFRIEDVAGYENAYLYENRMSSANNAEQHEFFSRYMQPLLKSVNALCGKDELERRILTDYMMAKHGLERNDYMRNEAAAAGEPTERDFAGLCGLTGKKDWKDAEAEAQKMIDDYEATHDLSLINQLWTDTKRATGATLEKIYLSGLISEDTYNKVLGMYDYYIPLRGWDETTSDEEYGYLTSPDGPLLGSVWKNAEGRESKADDPIATIAKMGDDAIRQGNRNVMKQRFLNFVHGNPSDLVSVSQLWLQHNDVTDQWEAVFADLEPDMTPAEIERELKLFEEKMEALAAAEPDKYKRSRDARNIPYKVVNGNLKEHQVLAKRNGHTYVMTINGNPRAAQALNGLTNPDTNLGGSIGDIINVVGKMNRQLSAFYTTRNPDFVMSNFLRDALYSNCMTWVKETPNYALRFHRNFGRVNPVIMHRLLRKWESGNLSDSNKLEKAFKEFMLGGGETGYTNVRDIEQHKKNIAKEMRKMSGRGPKVWGQAIWRWLTENLDLLNRSVENTARFAAFLTSREMGRTLDRSIYDAKEISVNFNKKGAGDRFVKAKGQTALGRAGGHIGGVGRAFYVFWNAGVQGMTNFGRAGKRNPKKAIAGAAALFTLGTVIPLLAQMLSGDGDDDDKNAYYNLPEYIRRSNICFKAGEQWITIPLPIEYRAIYGLGELSTGVISGKERYSDEELAYFIAAQVSQILPLDFLEGANPTSHDGLDWKSITHPFIPSAAKPFTEAYLMNRGWTGMPVSRDTPFNSLDPEFKRVYQSTDQHLVEMSRWLNKAGGGSDHRKAKIGLLDINPAKIEYMLNGTFGGMFTFPMKVKKGMIETPFGDRDFEWRNIPLANRVVKNGDERTENRKLQNEYYKYRNEAEKTEHEFKGFQKEGAKGILESAKRVDFMMNSDEFLRWQIIDAYEPTMAALRKAAQDVPDQRKEFQSRYYAKMRELVDALHDPRGFLKKSEQGSK